MEGCRGSDGRPGTCDRAEQHRAHRLPFPLAIDDSFSAADPNVELRFKAVGGKIDQAGGIAVRLADAETIMWRAPTRTTITSASTASSAVAANNWEGPI
jgi:hypothetical protein